MMHLSGKTVLITGASRGIGAEAARHFATLGSNVVLLARNQNLINDIADQIGKNALAISCDVSSYQDVAAAVSKAAAHFGTIDVVINNAGVIDPISRIETSEPEKWGQIVDINLKGVYHTMRASYTELAKTKGVIINLSSGAATNALEGWSHYCATKAAVLALTKCGHKEWAGEGISVIGLSPGTVATNMQRDIKDSGINPVSQLNWEAHISTRWVARALAWLTTDAAREFDGTDFSIKTEEGRRLVGLIE